MVVSRARDQSPFLWLMGGGDRMGIGYLKKTTMMIRPDAVTWGPDLSEPMSAFCSVTLGDGSVIITGGQRASEEWHNHYEGSPRVEVFNITTQEWSFRANMNQRRLAHSCAQVLVGMMVMLVVIVISQVWLDPEGLIAEVPSERSVQSVVVAGGECNIV